MYAFYEYVYTWPFLVTALRVVSPDGKTALAKHMRGKLMQPAEEVIHTSEEKLASSRKLIRNLEDPLFRQAYVKAWKQIQSTNIPNTSITHIFMCNDYPLMKSMDFHEKKIEYSGYLPIFVYPGRVHETLASLKERIWLDPYKKGILFEVSSGYIWKFRPTPPRISCENLFWKRFDRSKVNTIFKEWLWSMVLDLYIEHDDPFTDPVHSKREQLWHQALPLFRVYKQRVTHIDYLPYDVNPDILPMISFDTVKRNLQEISR